MKKLFWPPRLANDDEHSRCRPLTSRDGNLLRGRGRRDKGKEKGKDKRQTRRANKDIFPAVSRRVSVSFMSYSFALFLFCGAIRCLRSGWASMHNSSHFVFAVACRSLAQTNPPEIVPLSELFHHTSPPRLDRGYCPGRSEPDGGCHPCMLPSSVNKYRSAVKRGMFGVCGVTGELRWYQAECTMAVGES